MGQQVWVVSFLMISVVDGNISHLFGFASLELQRALSLVQ